ncbi:MAG: NifU family protein [Deltaproteobacteria bacterium]|nr:NifU family protein [Deltaproteobacteria bacterium]
MSEAEMDEQIKEALNEIRPALQADGGDIDYLGMEDGYVKVRLRGACSGCPSSTITLQMGVERAIRERVPEIKGVIPA